MKEEKQTNITPFVEDLTKIVIDIITSKHDVAIIAMYGSRARGDYAETSDLEFFAITEEENKIKLGFLFRGITVDLGSKTWDGIERIANREDYWLLPAGTTAVSKIVYSRSESDRIRYEDLRKKIIRDHNDPKVVHYEDAIDNYQGMLKSLGRLSVAKFNSDFNEAFSGVWGLLIGYTFCIANLNGKYLTNNWGKSLDELFTFPNQPPNAEEIISQLVLTHEIEKMIELGTELTDSLRIYIANIDDQIVENSDLEMLDNVNGLEYLYKMEKALSLNHPAALSYAIHDTQPLFAKDLRKIKAKWKKFHNLLIYSEYSKEYKKEFPDLMELMHKGDDQKLIKEIQYTRSKVMKYVKSLFDIQEFDELAEIKNYYNNNSF